MYTVPVISQIHEPHQIENKEIKVHVLVQIHVAASEIRKRLRKTTLPSEPFFFSTFNFGFLVWIRLLSAFKLAYTILHFVLLLQTIHE